MIVRVSEIPGEGLRVGSPTEVGPVYSEDGWSLEAISLAIERLGQEVSVRGGFGAAARVQCSRCLEPLVLRVEPEVDMHLVPAPTVRQGEVELGREDLEVDFYSGDTLDVGGLLRSETALALPMKPLCRDTCRGLCPACGGNRNQRDCACSSRGSDPRLAPLEALRRLP
jgi:uncharacterized protein